MNEFKWTKFLNLEGSELELHSGSWEQFCEDIIVNPPTGHTKSELPLIKLQEFGNVRSAKHSLRHNANVLKVYGIEGDYDAGSVSFEEATKRLKKHNIKALVYTTPSHTKEAPRWRVFCPLSQGVTPAEHHNLVAKLNGALKGILQSESFTLTQAMYFGQVIGTPYQSEIINGDYVDSVSGITPIGTRIKKEQVSQKDPLFISKEEAIKVLSFFDPDMPYPEWRRIGCGVNHEFEGSAVGFEIFYQWSQTGTRNPATEAFCWEKWQDMGSYDGEPVTMKALIHDAKQNGYKASSEVEKALRKHSLLDKSSVELSSKLEAPQWVVDGIIPNGVGVIAGVGGIGKTTALLPLTALIAGFDDKQSDVDIKIHRHVVYITEDATQAKRTIYGIKKHRKSSKDINLLDDYLHLYHSHRYLSKELDELISEAIERFSSEYRGITFPPLIVFDTASANIEIVDENSNSEISKIMTVFKQLWSKHDCPIWVITHLAKGANGKSIDEMASQSARGASAWKDNANWDALLASDAITNHRILKMGKVREELTFNELRFTSTVSQEIVPDVFGDDVTVKYRYSVVNACIGLERVIDNSDKKKENKNNEKKQQIIDFVSTMGSTSRNQIYKGKVVKGSEADIRSLILELLEEGKLFENEHKELEKKGG